MTTPAEPTLGKIRKLLAMAEGTDNPAERDAFNDKAAELIARHGVDEALLAAADPTRDDVGCLDVDVPGPYAADKSILLNSIALAMRCRAIRFTARFAEGGAGYRMRVYGFGVDRARVEVLYTSLLVQAHRGLQMAVPDWPLAGAQLAAYRRSWLAGFATEVGVRLRRAEARAQQQAEPPGGASTALVLVDRTARVDRHFRDAEPNQRTTSVRRSGSGYRAGRAAGERADLGGTRLAGTTRPAGALGGAS